MFVDMEALSICAKLLLAVLCGGIIGSERGNKGRPAGFRTHILVCLGSALTMMTSDFIIRTYDSATDPARLGAQVISGIGFLGAGTIIVTGKHQVRGLTTAAGLWASACMGLAIGIGYYKGALLACFFIWFVSAVLHNLDQYLSSRSQVVTVYVEFESHGVISAMIECLKKDNIRLSDMEIIGVGRTSADAALSAILSLRLPKKQSHAEIRNILRGMQGILYVEEL
ncbi:MgtC/SapB family protein [Oscillospiraceae bacterium MB08-C2-2]|nr:MgtC/SapB family protein [Oscillospiraceae bacterium MB08-C2-2]